VTTDDFAIPLLTHVREAVDLACYDIVRAERVPARTDGVA
jgi:hypothetical protein